MDLDFLTLSYDLDDKPTLNERVYTNVDVFACCQVDMKQTSNYTPPTSFSHINEICRFTEEAIYTQFHLAHTLKKKINMEFIEKLLDRVNEQLVYFLKEKGWQAQVHSLILIPTHLHHPQAKPDELSAITIGRPQLMCLKNAHPELVDFTGDCEGVLAEETRMHRGMGSSYPYDLHVYTLFLNRSYRILIGPSEWQQISIEYITPLFKSDWESLPNLLDQLMNHVDEDTLVPFSFVNLERHRALGKFDPAWLCKKLQKALKRLISRILGGA